MQRDNSRRGRSVRGVDDPAPDEPDTLLIGHAGTDHPAIVGGIPKNIPFRVADKNGGLMAKLRNGFFNYLRNRAL
jgi:hypothetical protein